MFYPMRQWDPFDALERMLSLWDPRFVGGPWQALPALPRVEMEQGEQEVVFRVEVPGISPEDLSVTVDGNVLTVRGVRRSPWTGSQGNGQGEGQALSFQRAFTLPSYIDPAGVKARYHQGVLEIRAPRTAGASGHDIPIDLQ